MKGWCDMTLQCDRHNMRTDISACFALSLVQFSLTGKHLNTKLINKISDYELNFALNSSDWWLQVYTQVYFSLYSRLVWGGAAGNLWSSMGERRAPHIAVWALGRKPETLANKCLVAEHGPGGRKRGVDKRGWPLHCQGKTHKYSVSPENKWFVNWYTKASIKQGELFVRICIDNKFWASSLSSSESFGARLYLPCICRWPHHYSWGDPRISETGQIWWYDRHNVKDWGTEDSQLLKECHMPRSGMINFRKVRNRRKLVNFNE